MEVKVYPSLFYVLKGGSCLFDYLIYKLHMHSLHIDDIIVYEDLNSYDKNNNDNITENNKTLIFSTITLEQ